MQPASRDDERDGRAATLPPAPASATTARHFVRELLPRHATPEQCATVELLTTELVANAVMHAGTPCRVRLTYPQEDVVRVEVTDHADGTPTIRHIAPTGSEGRGLLLVAALAARWGTAGTTRGGKTVWFELHL